MSRIYTGNGYEFSIRLPNYQKIWIHVTKAALDVLNDSQMPTDQLGVLAKEMPLLRKLALQRHVQSGNLRVVIDAADVMSGLGRY
jgi:hypothetical protein